MLIHDNALQILGCCTAKYLPVLVGKQSLEHSVGSNAGSAVRVRNLSQVAHVTWLAYTADRISRAVALLPAISLLANWTAAERQEAWGTPSAQPQSSTGSAETVHCRVLHQEAQLGLRRPWCTPSVLSRHCSGWGPLSAKRNSVWYGALRLQLKSS